jgi:hypothetical protein
VADDLRPEQHKQERLSGWEPLRAPLGRPHERRFSVAWWLKLLALVPLAVSAAFFLTVATTASEAAIPAVVIGAFAYLAWRKPGLVGGLLIAFAPFGAFAALLGSTNLDPASQVIFALTWFAGLPLASGVLLVVAARW